MPSTASPLVRFAAAKDEYTPLDGEQKLNLKVALDSPKVASQESVGQGDKKVYCRCWLSGTFPLCDGTHMKHNKATGDNVGPLIVSVPKENSKEEAKVAGRKKRVLMGYQVIMAAHVLLGARILSVAGPSVPVLVGLATNLALPIGVSYILRSAASNDRLSSDTYKRLNLTLLSYGLLSMVTLALKPTRRGSPLLYLPFALATINSVKGYAYGVLGWDKKNPDGTSLVQDFSSGVVSTVKGVVSLPKKFRSIFYLVACLGIGYQNLLQIVKISKLLPGGGSSLAPLISELSRGSFLWVILYTLKDAADRDRLTGTTFVQLHYLAALATVSAVTIPSAANLLSIFLVGNGLWSRFEKARAT